MKRIVRLKDKTTGLMESFSRITELVGAKPDLGISLPALYNALNNNNGRWENKRYKVYYEQVNLGKRKWE